MLESSAAHRLRAGEGAALVAEELALEQVLRNRRRIDRDESLGGARAVAMQRAGDEFLAGSRLARDEHRRVRLREPADGAKHLLHSGCLSEDLGFLLPCGGDRLDLAATFVEGAPHELHRVVHIERLRQVFEGAALECRYRALQVRVRGHDDDGRGGQALF